MQPTNTENMHKVVYLANEYPGSKLEKLWDLFELPLLDFNAAVWLAQDMGFLQVNDKTGKYKVTDLPTEWKLGERFVNLVNTLTFTFNRLASKETDLAEEELNVWMAGHPTHDQFIAMKFLINEGFLDSYELQSKDIKGAPSTKHTFYSLAANASKQWGRKQFRDSTKLV